MWAGSRMYRGDDIYLLDYWPLDNLNTVGGGARYDFTPNTYLAAHYGISQPTTRLLRPVRERAAAVQQPHRCQRAHPQPAGAGGEPQAEPHHPRRRDGGVKGVLYSELHQLPQGQYQLQAGQYESLPGDLGFVIGGQIGAFTGKRDTHVNLFVRYATGLAAYGDLTTPDQLAPDKTTNGAHELVVALGRQLRDGRLRPHGGRVHPLLPQRLRLAQLRGRRRGHHRPAAPPLLRRAGRRRARGIVPDAAARGDPRQPRRVGQLGRAHAGRMALRHHPLPLPGGPRATTPVPSSGSSTR